MKSLSLLSIFALFSSLSLVAMQDEPTTPPKAQSQHHAQSTSNFANNYRNKHALSELEIQDELARTTKIKEKRLWADTLSKNNRKSFKTPRPPLFN